MLIILISVALTPILNSSSNFSPDFFQNKRGVVDFNKKPKWSQIIYLILRNLSSLYISINSKKDKQLNLKKINNYILRR